MPSTQGGSGTLPWRHLQTIPRVLKSVGGVIRTILGSLVGVTWPNGPVGGHSADNLSTPPAHTSPWSRRGVLTPHSKGLLSSGSDRALGGAGGRGVEVIPAIVPSAGAQHRSIQKNRSRDSERRWGGKSLELGPGPSPPPGSPPGRPPHSRCSGPADAGSAAPGPRTLFHRPFRAPQGLSGFSTGSWARGG